MKVALIHPPHLNSTDDRLDPPMGLLYIAATLERNNIDTEIVDLSGYTNIGVSIPYAQIYGITAYVPTVNTTKEIIRYCQQTNPLSKIVVGGAHPSACPQDFTDVADYVVLGQGEEAMLQIINKHGVPRILIGTEPKDPFPFPAYNLVDIKSYHRTIAGRASLPYITSRGCPFKCAFCGLAGMHKLGLGVRMAEPEIVYKHIKRMKDEFGIDRVNFQDDIFTFNPRRLQRILNLITPLNIRFRCHGRAGYDTEDTYARLADAGCEQVAWGIESGSQDILNRMRKQVTVKDNLNVIKWAKKHGITSRAFFIFGFPGETEKTIEETKQFIEESDPDQYFVSNFIPYPGTDVGDRPDRYGITRLSKNYNQYYQVSKDGTGGTTIDTEWLSRDEFRALELSFREWLVPRAMRGALLDYEIKLRGGA